MHRPPKLPAAAAAGLALFLVACAGETPTSPKPAPSPGSGSCTVAIALPAGPITTYAGTAISLRAQVTSGGVAVADNTSVSFTTDLGFFNENGLPTISKTTRSGVADVSPGSLTTGTATVRAAFDCASASVQIQFQAPPDTGPYISDVQPKQGTSAGGDLVVISGGRFGTSKTAISSVMFGGNRTDAITVTDSSITVKSPPWTLANPQVPESVYVCVNYAAGVFPVCTKDKAFTYYAIDPNKKMTVSSLAPTSGAPAGGDSVTILGNNFGSSIATARITFCGLPAQILSMSDNNIGLTTPRKTLANPAVSETCDVVVTIDLGKVSMQSAVLPQAFTYRGSGGSGTCGTDPSLFVASLSPNTGPPDGGTTITIAGGGFPTSAASVRVEFGGTAAQVLNAGPNTIGVVAPRHTLADPLIPEVVDVVVTDLGSPTARCARFSAGFTYTQQALTPVIYSVSPTGGPNDTSISVTISGDGFQYPENVYLTGGGCGTQLVPTTVNSVSRSQIVFMSPLASGAGSFPCLAGSQMDVRVSNPSTGKSATYREGFRYGCPTVTGVSPSVLPTGRQTAVTISGANFQSPVQAIFQAAGLADYSLTVSSVTPSAIVVQMPPLSTIAPSQPACQPLVGTIILRTTGLACTVPAQGSVTYRPDAPTLASAAPTALSQDGSPSGAYGSGSATVTVSGSGFADPMTVVLTKDGVPVAGTTVAATVSSTGTLTFKAPAIPDTSLNSATCASTPGGPLDGTQNVPTAFGIRVTNKTSGCSSDLPGVLLYSPRAQLAACSPAPLDPVIYSLSPNTGPNDTPTLVTMSGINFQNPAKVYVAGGACGSALIEATVIGAATPTQLTFQTPVAAGPGLCLSGAQVDVQILNPSGRKNTLSGGFKYYSCASITGVTPAVISTGTMTPVLISGANFPPNVQATFQGGSVPTVQLTVSSVTPNSVLVQMPPLSALSPSLASTCQALAGTIVLSSPTLLCNPVQTSISYNPSSLALTSASPAIVNQDGSSLGAPGTPAVVTVNGSGWSGTDPMTVDLIKDGSLVPGTTVSNVTVSGTGTLTFLAPAVPDTSLNTGQCSSSGGTVDGTQSIPTRFGIRVKNGHTGCTSDLPAALLYNPKASLALCVATALTPTINSISPTTGPNDSPTRVTIFGTGFQFPEQVFLTGGACGAQKIEVPVVAPVTLNQIVFQTPVAAGGYACLAGAQLDVQVLNPTTGKTANCPSCFKFYACPTATTAAPAVLGSNGGTVIISGNNFQQPVVATYVPSVPAGLPTAKLTVLSVSSTSVILQMPPVSYVVGGSGTCSQVVGTVNISSTALSCLPAQVPLTYKPDPPTLTSASPTTLPQDPGGAPITVNGNFFVVGDPLSVTLIKDNSPISGTTSAATVTADGVLTFTAPPIPDSAFNRDNCATVPGGPINGSKAVPTQIGIRVTNLANGCSGDLPGVLLYNPRAAIAVCTASLQITTAGLPGSATLCSLYSTPITATGGLPPYTFALSGAPAWLSIGLLSGVLAGTPNILSPAGTGGAYSISFSVFVTDSVLASTSRSFSLVVTDPDGPFSISGPSSVTIPSGGGSIPLSVLPATGFAPYNWAFVGPPPPAGITLSSPTGVSISVNVAPAVPPGPYSISVEATDSPSCGGATHTFTLPIAVTKSP